MMPLDVYHLQSFYDSPLGELSRRLVGRVIRARWQDAAGLSVAALGFGSPYLDRFRGTAARCIALMPAQQGVLIWPEAGRCSCALVEAQMLPLPDASVDRLLLAHALEAAERPEALLEELWRITAPEGRVILVVPSRRGVWARVDGTPYGQGLPYSRGQLRDLLQRALFSPIFLGRSALRAANRLEAGDSYGADHRTARRGARSPLRRSAYCRGDQAGLSALERACRHPKDHRAAQSGARADHQPGGHGRSAFLSSTLLSWRRAEPVFYKL